MPQLKKIIINCNPNPTCLLVSLILFLYILLLNVHLYIYTIINDRLLNKAPSNYLVSSLLFLLSFLRGDKSCTYNFSMLLWFQVLTTTNNSKCL